MGMLEGYLLWAFFRRGDKKNKTILRILIKIKQIVFQ